MVHMSVHMQLGRAKLAPDYIYPHMGTVHAQYGGVLGIYTVSCTYIKYLGIYKPTTILFLNGFLINDFKEIRLHNAIHAILECDFRMRF